MAKAIINGIKFVGCFFLYGTEMKYRGRTLCRVWFATMFAMAILLASITGVDASPVQGEGFAPATAVNAAQEKMLALRAAEVVAIRNGQQQGYSQIAGVISKNYDAATKTAVVVLDMR